MSLDKNIIKISYADRLQQSKKWIFVVAGRQILGVNQSWLTNGFVWSALSTDYSPTKFHTPEYESIN